MKRAAFTMVELVVVVGIIGTLTAISIIGFGRQQAQARDARRKADITNINTGLQSYINEKQEPPNVDQYPNRDGFDCGWWDYSSENGCNVADPNGDHWLSFLKPFMNGTVPHDPINNGTGDVCNPSNGGGDGYAYSYAYYKGASWANTDGYSGYVIRVKLEQTGQCPWTRVPTVPY